MKVRELIAELQKFDSEYEVIITDGHSCSCYHTNGLQLQEWKDDDGTMCVDIGIGGLNA